MTPVLHISLSITINGDEYVVFPKAALIAPVRNKTLNPPARHPIPVIAPMIRDDRLETLKVKRIYVCKKAQLQPRSIWSDTCNALGYPESTDGPDQYSVTRKML
jgi:hypothetical protein